MEIIDRLTSAFAGVLFGVGIALAVVYWLDFGAPSFVFKSCMVVGGVGGFLFGREFLDFLSSFMNRIW